MSISEIRISSTSLAGLVLIEPPRYTDERGFLSESWNRDRLREAGLDLPEFVQDNQSFSMKSGTIRGLHYQAPPYAQGKLVRCGRGSVMDVAVDVRRGSPTYGQWHTQVLSFDNGLQLWIPPGFLHGFATREPESEVIYKCTAPYCAASDGCVRWDSLGIAWDVETPVLSAKDASAAPFYEFESPFIFGHGT